MQKIVPHLWFDKEAKEAAKFYAATIGGDSKVTNVTTIHDTPGGDADVVSFKLAGQDFMAISAGPIFKFNPSISFLIACDSKEEVDRLWQKLGGGGSVLMELAAYPFSEKYGWLADKYGLSWQVMFVGDRPISKKITPVLMFAGPLLGRAEEAINFYTSVFPVSKINTLSRKGKMIEFGTFTLETLEIGIMDSEGEHKFAFNEAISFMINSEDQPEIDYWWEKLSAVPEAEQCGWLKDKFGVSWQVVPIAPGEMMTKGTPEQRNRLTQDFLKMKKFDIAELEKAFEG